MTSSHDRRRATRITVHIPATLEVLAEPPVERALDPGYECIAVPSDLAGERFEATIRNLSVNGAKLVGQTVPPLLSRLSVSFDLPGYGMALAIVIVMWRRATHFLLPPQATEIEASAVSPGFGVLFEAVDLEIRNFIAEMIQRANLGM